MGQRRTQKLEIKGIGDNKTIDELFENLSEEDSLHIDENINAILNKPASNEKNVLKSLYESGVTNFNQKNFDEAKKYFQQVIGNDRYHASEARSYLALISYIHGDGYTMDKWMEKVNPNEISRNLQFNFGVYNFILTFYEDVNFDEKLNDSYVYFIKALDISKTSRTGVEDDEILRWMGVILRAKDSFEVALQYFNYSLDVNQKNAKTHADMAYTYDLMKLPELASDHARKATKLDHESFFIPLKRAGFF